MKTQNPLIGRSRKSYGDATFYTLNGENIVRTKAMVVANPNTPAQEAQRVRFKAFTAAANSVSEADLNMLFKTTEVGRNRRSMLQAQLAPAFGSQPTTDPDAAEKYEATFDVFELDKIGSGPVGYIGDLVPANFVESNPKIGASRVATLKSNMVLDGSETHVFLVCITEDGCVIKVANPVTMSDFDAAISSETDLTINGVGDLIEHGENIHCYAIGGKLQLIGLGTFSVAERPARKGHNPRHAKPI